MSYTMYKPGVDDEESQRWLKQIREVPRSGASPFQAVDPKAHCGESLMRMSLLMKVLKKRVEVYRARGDTANLEGTLEHLALCQRVGERHYGFAKSKEWLGQPKQLPEPARVEARSKLLAGDHWLEEVEPEPVKPKLIIECYGEATPPPPMTEPEPEFEPESDDAPLWAMILFAITFIILVGLVALVVARLYFGF